MDNIKEDNFTYEKPNEEIFFKGLMAYLRSNSKKELVDLIKYAKCEIKTTTNFSRIRWNAYAAEVYFYLPIDELELIEVSDHLKSDLKGYCSKIMPYNYGYDILAIEFLPLIVNRSDKGLIQDLDDLIRSLPEEIKNQILPEDIKKKGKEMAELYLYLYYVENSLRLFIEKVSIDKFGIDYFDYLKLNKKIKNYINGRKQKESKNRWLCIRGDSEIFHLDFKDLGTIIQNNWELFEEYFPTQNWILGKIDEIAECRHLVAHNNFIPANKRDIVKVYYNNILDQLNNVMSKNEGLGIT